MRPTILLPLLPISNSKEPRPSDGSGSIDREEFLQIPQIASNPLSSRMIAIFDEEYVVCFFWKGFVVTNKYG